MGYEEEVPVDARCLMDVLAQSLHHLCLSCLLHLPFQSVHQHIPMHKEMLWEALEQVSCVIRTRIVHESAYGSKGG